MNVTVYRIKKGDTLEVFEPGMETAVLFAVGQRFLLSMRTKRSLPREGSVFKEPPVCLHVCKDVAVAIKAHEDSEILQQSTYNDREFPSRLFREKDISQFVSCEGRWENTAVRDVVDIITIRNSPIRIWCWARFTQGRADGGATYPTTPSPKCIIIKF